MSKFTIWHFIVTVGILSLGACTGSEHLQPAIPDLPTAAPTTVGPTGAAHNPTPTPVPITPVKPPVTPTVRPNPSPIPQKTPETPSHTLALFYRASFGDDTKTVAAPDGTTITWETGASGIARFIPSAGRSEVIKSVTSASYSKSVIYPLTVGDHLFSIRDWGSDWTIKNKDFTIEELN